MAAERIATLGASIFYSLGKIFLVFLVMYTLSVIAMWRVFNKAGEKGWKSLIPVYNIYVLFNLFWSPTWFWLMFGVYYVLNVMLSGMANLVYMSIVIGFVFYLYCYINLMNRVAKSFGKGLAFTIGLIFLPNIFQLILAFNSAEYTKIED